MSRSTVPTLGAPSPGSPRARKLAGYLLTLCAACCLALTACKAKYPNCEADTDCPGNAQGKEFCVNGMCQACRPGDAYNDCGQGQQCRDGRCEKIPGFCRTSAECPTGLCQNNRCVNCKDDKQCPSGSRCQAGICESDARKPCKTSDECSETEDCVNGRCAPAGKNRYAADSAGCQLEVIYFGYNEFELSGSASAVVDKNAECIKKSGRGVNVIGHTDPRGTMEYNLALSDKRAQAVTRRLAALGIAADKMAPVPRGELDSNGTDESGWDKDRRVEVQWR